SFLAAHIAYLTAFSLGVGFGSRPVLLLPYAIAAIAVMWILWPRLGRLRVPVVVYVAALVAMAWQATTRAVVIDTEPAIAAAVGAALFVVSDATLAINRFRVSFRASQAVVMSTYVAAQALIALSVSQTAR
ncbi:MAG: lysoplasmalogenase family protein, partial [Thermoanaerobaculia bacterium]